jgi:hypothetical protein
MTKTIITRAVARERKIDEIGAIVSRTTQNIIILTAVRTHQSIKAIQ